MMNGGRLMAERTVYDIASLLEIRLSELGITDETLLGYLDEFKNIASFVIQWSVEDFEEQAMNRCDDDYPGIYDPSKFEEALYMMMKDHDAEMGITWDTVDHYLDLYCKK